MARKVSQWHDDEVGVTSLQLPFQFFIVQPGERRDQADVRQGAGPLGTVHAHRYAQADGLPHAAFAPVGGADWPTFAAYLEILGPPPEGYAMAVGQALTLTLALPPTNVPPLTFAWDLNADGVFGDVTGAGVTVPWPELAPFGITGEGTYWVGVRVRDGTTAIDIWTVLTVSAGDGAPFVPDLSALAILMELERDLAGNPKVE